MSVSEEDYELILKYLNGSLNHQEMRQFKKLRSTSVAFAREVANANSVLLALNVEGNESRTREMGRLARMLEEDLEESKHVGWILLGVLSILASLGLVLFFNLSHGYLPDSSGTFDKYYKEFSVVISEDYSVNDHGINLYMAGRYREAIPFLKILSLESSYKISTLYLANAYIKVGDFNRAEEALLSLRISDGNWYLSQHKYWYLALVHLKKGNTDKSIEILSQLVSGGGMYARQSLELLDLLK